MIVGVVGVGTGRWVVFGRESLTRQRAGVWSSLACRAACPFVGLIYARSSVTLAPALFAGAPALWSWTMRLYEVSACWASSSSASRIRSLVDQIPAARRVYFGAPAVISRRRSFLRVSEGCWWA